MKRFWESITTKISMNLSRLFMLWLVITLAVAVLLFVAGGETP